MTLPCPWAGTRKVHADNGPPLKKDQLNAIIKALADAMIHYR
jgi:hypothetical protein